jgi:hypothetical protein
LRVRQEERWGWLGGVRFWFRALRDLGYGFVSDVREGMGIMVRDSPMTKEEEGTEGSKRK